jgi:hypothetical protein
LEDRPDLTQEIKGTGYKNNVVGFRVSENIGDR